MHDQDQPNPTPQPRLLQQDGRVWFSRETERRFYFILTVIMMVMGILYKTGVI
jgi:hypothetical protein